MIRRQAQSLAAGEEPGSGLTHPGGHFLLQALNRLLISQVGHSDVQHTDVLYLSGSGTWLHHVQLILITPERFCSVDIIAFSNRPAFRDRVNDFESIKIHRIEIF
ncbi:hypothetical protein SAMN05192556_11321 [Halomonas caseinilytica]|uniref:Uncharacterized protein n=1 Tax=Halomonas caseinilytica TaxID=438744 RepID=A0A1M7ACN8_9GAMM|nr:hypothetical protein SAMN05192556_11321 [Halomonas caseinilytica]